jgi:hypothetical protein
MLTDRYWIYKEGFLRGPFPVVELVTSGDFKESLLVCQDGDDQWHPVRDVSAFRDYCPPKIISSGDYPPKPD